MKPAAMHRPWARNRRAPAAGAAPALRGAGSVHADLRRLVAGLLASSLLLVVCGGGPGGPSGGATGSGVGSAAGAGQAFPVTVEHKFGETTITEEPERVVALGYQEQDPLLALGVTPVAVRYWFGPEDQAAFPWARDELGGADPEILNMGFGELDYEKIATLEPDLLSGVYSGITEQEYDRLSRIAPTITQTGDYIDFGMPWQESTVMIGRAVGRGDRARRIVAELEARFEQVREDHPAFVGSSVAVAKGPSEGRDRYSVFTSEDARARVFTLLGFEVPRELDQLAGDSFFAAISREQVKLLDRDLLAFIQMQFVGGGESAIRGDPLIQRLEVLEEGRTVFVGGQLDDALQFSTVLSLPLVLDRLVPMLEAAMDGDPETVPSAPAPSGERLS